MKLSSTFLASALLALSVQASAADAIERKFIREGMHEAEVIMKIGKPDHETYVKNVKGRPEVKTWSYFPASRDRQTLTVITLRAGVVAEVDRKIAR